MASGFGTKGYAGRCYETWQDFSKCMSNAADPSECMLKREDYFECLHHRKEIAKYNAIKAEMVNKLQKAKEKEDAESGGFFSSLFG
mmetsp:Transcript_42037/g.50955  ORF Transcript_42037/g.50955 Transcript_42037/m.50955 type:complete len:86 (+) Transcript_42037:112-369(+)|eukprot:CAMPEP_0197856336 /NCGR_PEP_ID=MMETSP1438-20131217/28380_1 /TAXON_ID=1461541 /ORGANISM="Pterosperma sp., Strain CCMP1384" /LENGTH=85 /DNA_ID=CAMNT_0043471759 /DNA_START=85 /DNA_END=342 /DNA_ORIENTATION=+